MYIYVANESTLKRQKSGEPQNVAKPNDYWVARILEIRAADEHHVYARVYWMYSPEEIPANSTDRRATVSGRQPYHGANELIASNHSMKTTPLGDIVVSENANTLYASGCH